MADESLRPTADPDGCEASRRAFLRAAGAVALSGSVPLLGASRVRADDLGPTPSSPSETSVARFYKSLRDDQKKLICFPFDHPKRSQVNNNWAIVPNKIEDLTGDQQALCQEIFRGLLSEDGHDRFTRQMEEDYGGFDQYHVAVFGEPGGDQPFEWVLTGRHDTLRADGNSVQGAAFGGPIFYGHAAHSFNEDAKHTDNVWWYQGQKANAIFKTLDETQQRQALIEKAEDDSPRSIQLKGDKLAGTGLAVGELDGQQQKMVEELIRAGLQPFREADAQEALECLKEAGGVEKLRLTYAKEGDIGEDGVWDIWKLEGPAFAWFFRGSPHVHTWLNVARKA